MNWLLRRIPILSVIDRWFMSRYPYLWAECFHFAALLLVILCSAALGLALWFLRSPREVGWELAWLILLLSILSFVWWMGESSTREGRNFLPPMEKNDISRLALAREAVCAGLIMIPLILHWGGATLIALISHPDRESISHRGSRLEMAWQLWYAGACFKVKGWNMAMDEPDIPDGFTMRHWDFTIQNDREWFPMIWQSEERVPLETWEEYQWACESIDVHLDPAPSEHSSLEPYGLHVQDAHLDQLAVILNEELRKHGAWSLPKGSALAPGLIGEVALVRAIRLPGWKSMHSLYHPQQSALLYTGGLNNPVFLVMLIATALSMVVIATRDIAGAHLFPDLPTLLGVSAAWIGLLIALLVLEVQSGPWWACAVFFGLISLGAFIELKEIRHYIPVLFLPAFTLLILLAGLHPGWGWVLVQCPWVLLPFLILAAGLHCIYRPLLTRRELTPSYL